MEKVKYYKSRFIDIFDVEKDLKQINNKLENTITNISILVNKGSIDTKYLQLQLNDIIEIKKELLSIIQNLSISNLGTFRLV